MAGSSNDVDIMKRIAAGVMAGQAPAPKPSPIKNAKAPAFVPRGTLQTVQAPPSPSTPRTVPTMPTLASIKKENATPPHAVAAQAKKENAAPVQAVPQETKVAEPAFTFTAPPPVETPPVQTPPAKTSPTITERDPNVQANLGPSLRGTVDQLAVAREFLSSTSHGKIRPSRSRLVSRDRESRVSNGATFGSSTFGSPRPAQALLASQGRGLSPVTTPSPRRSPRLAAKAEAATSAASTSPWSSFASLHDRTNTASFPIRSAASMAVQPPATPIPAPASIAVSKIKEDPVESVTKSMEKTTIDEPKVSASPAKKLVNGSLGSRQMAQITDVLKDRATDLPPHLRAKAAAKKVDSTDKTEPPAKLIVTIPIAKTADEAETKPAPVAIATAPLANDKQEVKAEEKIVPKPAMTTENAVSHQEGISESDKTAGEAPEKTASKRSAEAAFGTKQNPIVINGDSDSSKSAKSSSDELMAQLTALKAQVAVLSARVATLEGENFAMEKKVGELVQVEERRKFLGTDSFKAPFTVVVTYPTGAAYDVQVTTELRVTALIRRARAKANIRPEKALNPRIVVKGEQVGHLMTIGELRVKQGEKVAFLYDGPMDEQL